ncbi:MAG: DUF2252 domain-containing protein [Terracidiphilus sp.]
MAIAKLLPTGVFDLGTRMESWENRRAAGKALRHAAPLESHAKYTPGKNRPDPLKLLAKSNAGRQAHLVPLRMGRMASSPFAFLRGSACVMASDLSVSPISGIPVVMCGDAHINNFGMYGTPQREVVFDLNDFDEAVVGPWEWDLKRMVASVNVAGRQNGLNRRERAAAVKRAVEGYRLNVTRLQNMGILDVWYLHAHPGRMNPIAKVDVKSKAVISKTVAKALRTDNRALLPKVADRQGDAKWTLRNDPPVLTTIPRATKEKVIEGLNRYSASIGFERRMMLGRYHISDIAHRVVGIGSVGTRAYLALLFGTGDNDPLFLQVKECVPAAHAPYLPPLSKEIRHDGMRVVIGQRALQASSDPMLGYTEIDGRPYLVRQMKNLKASMPVEFLTGSSFNFYAWACGAILARAHSRTGDPARIAGYCGKSDALDEALAQWAESYGDQTEEDHATLLASIKRGATKADIQSDDES